jgi:hypothetical protein
VTVQVMQAFKEETEMNATMPLLSETIPSATTLAYLIDATPGGLPVAARVLEADEGLVSAWLTGGQPMPAAASRLLAEYLAEQGIEPMFLGEIAEAAAAAEDDVDLADELVDDDPYAVLRAAVAGAVAALDRVQATVRSSVDAEVSGLREVRQVLGRMQTTHEDLDYLLAAVDSVTAGAA